MRKIQESIDNCTKNEVQGDFLRPQHKHLTPATVVDIHVKKRWWYDLKRLLVMNKIPTPSISPFMRPMQMSHSIFFTCIQ